MLLIVLLISGLALHGARAQQPVSPTVPPPALPAPQVAPESWLETKDGVTYQVTRKVEKSPVVETRMQQQSQTVFETEYSTEMREVTKTVWVPVTEYVTEPRWHQWWNPFVEPYMTYDTRPVTRWELRTQTVREPVTTRRELPQERLVEVPVRSLGFVERPYEERIVVSKPSVAPTPTGLPATTDPRYAQRAAPPVRSEFSSRGQPATTLVPTIRR